MEKTSSELIGAIIIGSILLVILAVFTLLFFLLYIKKKVNLKQQNENLKSAFQQELLQTQIEIQEETFNHISEEIHDNIGQVLSFLKLNLNLKDSLSKEELEEKINSSRELVSAVIKDVRNLSKSLSYDYIKAFGLNEALQNELNRVNQTNDYKASFKSLGDEFIFSENFNLLVFRIFQECLNNIIKHAKANIIDVQINYKSDRMEMHIKDNGIGFSVGEDENKYGSGLKNIKKRAKLLEAVVCIESVLGVGTTIVLSVPFNVSHGKN